MVNRQSERASPGGPPACLDIAVVIPAFRASAHVAEAVRSALAQVPPPVEVIVVDDCSDDDTAEAAARAGARVICHSVNQGQGAARQTATDNSSATWLAWLDADDLFVQGHLARLYANRGDHVLVSDAALGSISRMWYGWGGLGNLVLRSPRQLVVPANPVVVSAAMTRRDALTSVGGFATRRFGEDLETWIRLVQAGYTGLVLPRVGLTYREHSTQMSQSEGMRATGETVLSSFSREPWFRERDVRALEITTMWNHDRRHVISRPRQLPALARYLGSRRVASLRGRVERFRPQPR